MNNCILVKSKYAKDELIKNGFKVLKVDTYHIHNSKWNGCTCCPSHTKKTGYVFDNPSGISAKQVKKQYGIVCNIV